ncbi:stage III sporulation protein AA [Paenibacillus baekrokdamisoli]|uniref:Stage III sporulation protein AA n=1 Tax=Paenibacillus baekrokdamisoli TaxID=1712516 RepID=A0A3G9J5U2_9BACL|nr:stage III sporulation protein AA [Paenibacillus baekrokdamisoli]MBB3070109.1 stage III sporulation protein AA [Paenibacillus baekrokdamisoli]BBH21121.1 stage III sporulation protein AA [Paenibacillus baekrokdamisoli]
MLIPITNLLPSELHVILGRIPEQVKASVEEIRIREGKPLEIGTADGFWFVSPAGTLLSRPEEAYKPSTEVCRKLLEKVTNHSLYSMEEELRRGYITIAGGHRIGIAGRTVLENGTVRGIRDVAAFNLRIAREVIGAAASILPKLLDINRRSILPVLIIAPPQQGKTTFVRDLARAVSSGAWGHPAAAGWTGRKVGIVDERSEIAACVRGVPTFNVGPRTDVMDACPKAEGMMMMLRSMSPEVIIVDEIGRDEDADAILDASHAGISVIATAHANDIEDARGRPVLRRLLEEGAFKLCVELRRSTAGGITSRVVPALAAGRAPTAREPTTTKGGGAFG